MSARRARAQPGALEALAGIEVQSLIPVQQATPLKLLKAADCYEMRCLKYPERALFHSYAEFLHALLLEADPRVSAFVPQPFRLEIGRAVYIPDVYVIRDRRPAVLELKPRGEMEPRLQSRVTTFFEWHDLPFAVIANESVLAHETLALNWLALLQVLVQAHRHGLQTDALEQALLWRCEQAGPLRVGDLLDGGDRSAGYANEVALYRLLHQHRLAADLTRDPLDYDTEVAPCR